ncbi:Hypothetical predicted protein [Cloeon dipterum]|uniref:Uncharacterized protein n=1 Tax=Cloeon dipterum TaxID=197152 RepID=A0A8S1EER5_9INSE|nr:Hypothetical predicted protein [Cloeon dipterum]
MGEQWYSSGFQIVHSLLSSSTTPQQGELSLPLSCLYFQWLTRGNFPVTLCTLWVKQKPIVDDVVAYKLEQMSCSGLDSLQLEVHRSEKIGMQDYFVVLLTRPL